MGWWGSQEWTVMRTPLGFPEPTPSSGQPWLLPPVQLRFQVEMGGTIGCLAPFGALGKHERAGVHPRQARGSRGHGKDRCGWPPGTQRRGCVAMLYTPAQHPPLAPSVPSQRILPSLPPSPLPNGHPPSTAAGPWNPCHHRSNPARLVSTPHAQCT